jgi:hypothetical protein
MSCSIKKTGDLILKHFMAWKIILDTVKDRKNFNTYFAVLLFQYRIYISHGCYITAKNRLNFKINVHYWWKVCCWENTRYHSNTQELLYAFFLPSLSIESRAKSFLSQLAGLHTSVLMHRRHVERQSSRQSTGTYLALQLSRYHPGLELVEIGCG